MKYYQITDDSHFIGTATSDDWRRFQHKHQVLAICGEDEAEYLQHGETLYRDERMLPAVTDAVPYVTAKIVEIDQTEYARLAAMENGGIFGRLRLRLDFLRQKSKQKELI